MADKELDKNKIEVKPPEIIELERELGIQFEKIGYNDHTANGYAIDSDNQVVKIVMRGVRFGDFSIFKKFKHLRSLEVADSNISELTGIASLSSLNALDISENAIQDISPLMLLPNLKYLDISFNPIKDISLVGNLQKLKKLECFYNNIKSIDFIKNLENLEILKLGANSITDINILKNLPRLNDIQLNFNNIEDIAPISYLNKASRISLYANSLKKVPYLVASRFNWLNNSLSFQYQSGEIYLKANPLEYPPVSVIELGPEVVKNYYEMSEEYGHAPLSEGRVIFVGDGSSGKSSIIEKVLYNTFEKGREQTNGIRIEHMHLQHPNDQRDLIFHLWDWRSGNTTRRTQILFY